MIKYHNSLRKSYNQSSAGHVEESVFFMYIRTIKQ